MLLMLEHLVSRTPRPGTGSMEPSAAIQRACSTKTEPVFGGVGVVGQDAHEAAVAFELDLDELVIAGLTLEDVVPDGAAGGALGDLELPEDAVAVVVNVDSREQGDDEGDAAEAEQRLAVPEDGRFGCRGLGGEDVEGKEAVGEEDETGVDEDAVKTGFDDLIEVSLRATPARASARCRLLRIRGEG